MWPILHDMTRDDCRRALRRLELEAYTSMISVFRAQGALADDRKKLLEEIRSALSISNDRHSAEARRVSNDELLGTIAQQLSGPNTDMGWFTEGRREIPILPRGIPQTMYTAIADEAIKEVVVENEKCSLKAAEQRKAAPVSPKSPVESTAEDMELDETSAATAESGKSPNVYTLKGKNNSEGNYPPVVMWDQWLKVSNDDGPPRKRSRADSSTQHHRPTQQRYLNISQVYSNYSKTPTAKSANQYGKNSYGQTGKISGKSNHASKSSISKQRSLQAKHNKHSGQVAIPHHQVRSGIKSPNDHHMAGSQALNIQNILDTNTMKTQTSDFQANFIQSLGKNINLEDQNEAKQCHVTANMLESPTMQLLTQPPPALRETASSPSPSHDEMQHAPVSGQGTILTTHISSASPTITKVQQSVSGKPCHLIIKKKGDAQGDSSSHKIQVSSMQVISKPTELGGIKVLQNRQVVVAPPQNVSQKLFNSSGKLITTKIVQQIPQKAQTPTPVSKSLSTNTMMEKIMIVSKSHTPSPVQPGILQRSLSNASTKNVIISGQNTFNTVSKDVDLGNQISKNVDSEGMLAKGVTINNSEMKLSTKTFLLNPKSGQKMVVVPAKARGKGSLMGQTMPLLQVKGIHGRPTMKLVPVSGQSVSTPSKSSNVTVVSGAASSNILTTKIISKESLMHIKPNIMSGESPINKLSSNVQMSTKSPGQAIIRPAGSKGNLILVQKGNSLGKGPITLTKNGKDLSKIVMSSKRVNPLVSQPTPAVSNRDLQEASTVDSSVSKNPGNVIVLELRNDQLEHGCGGQEYLEGDEGTAALTPNDHLDLKAKHTIITEDTPVLFHNQLSDDVCNADSMESTADSFIGSVHIRDALKSNDLFSEEQELQKITSRIKPSEDQTVSSAITDWDMELDNASDKSKINKIDDANMELEESSGSDTDEYMVTAQDNEKKIIQHTTGDDSLIRDAVNTDANELYTPHTSISQASRTLLSQLQDEGSSSNDSPFVLSKDLGKTPSRLLSKFKVQTDHNAQSLSKASIKNKSAQGSKDEDSPATESESAQPSGGTGQSCSVKSMSRPGRMDIFRTALVSADINLESFEYLEDGMMSTEEIFPLKGPESIPDKDKIHQSLEQQLSQLLNEDIDSTRLEVLESPQIGSGAIE